MGGGGTVKEAWMFVTESHFYSINSHYKPYMAYGVMDNGNCLRISRVSGGGGGRLLMSLVLSTLKACVRGKNRSISWVALEWGHLPYISNWKRGDGKKDAKIKRQTEGEVKKKTVRPFLADHVLGSKINATPPTPTSQCPFSSCIHPPS